MYPTYRGLSRQALLSMLSHEDPGTIIGTAQYVNDCPMVWAILNHGHPSECVTIGTYVTIGSASYKTGPLLAYIIGHVDMHPSGTGITVQMLTDIVNSYPYTLDEGQADWYDYMPLDTALRVQQTTPQV